MHCLYLWLRPKKFSSLYYMTTITICNGSAVLPLWCRSSWINANHSGRLHINCQPSLHQSHLWKTWEDLQMFVGLIESIRLWLWRMNGEGDVESISIQSDRLWIWSQSHEGEHIINICEVLSEELIVDWLDMRREVGVVDAGWERVASAICSITRPPWAWKAQAGKQASFG